MHVVVDTTALRSDPLRRSAAWKLLARLSQSDKVQIYLSDITRREFITHREDEFDSATAEVRKASEKLIDLVPWHESMDEIRASIGEIESRRKQVGHSFDAWLDDTKFNVLPVDDNHTSKVIDAYFNGYPPFPHKKSRKDFPDAFIYQSVVDLKGVLDELHVVTNDNNLGSKLGELTGIVIHESVEKFIKHESVSPLATRMESIAWFLEFATAADGIATDQSIVGAIETQLPGKSVEGFPEHYEATVQSYGEITNLVVDKAGFEDYGDGVIVLAFSTKCECIVEYFLPKFVLWGLEVEFAPSSYQDWNDHVFHVDQYHNLVIQGRIVFEAEPGDFDGNIKKLKEWSEIIEATEFDVQIAQINSEESELLQAIYE